jgi:hypothetical protein
MRHGSVSVHELSEWDVGTVLVHNSSSSPLLAMSGELIFDGMQDRTLAESRVIPPGATEEVHVNCVEVGRDEGGGTFHHSHARVDLVLRHVVRFGDQQKVWDTVAKTAQRLGVDSQSHTYRLVAQLQDVGVNAERRAKLLQALDALPEHDRIVGLAVAIDGRIAAIDQFANPNLFHKLAAELLGSYIMAEDGKPREGKQITPADVREFASRSDHLQTVASVEMMVR